jgi:hypothetical protein
MCGIGDDKDGWRCARRVQLLDEVMQDEVEPVDDVVQDEEKPND